LPGLLAWLLGLALAPAVNALEYCDQSPPAGLAAKTSRATLILIIDDLGHRRRNGMAMVELKGKINLAVLPHTPHATELAEAGFAAGKEIMLHAPMSSARGTAVGKGGLTPQLSREEFDRILTDNIDAIPHVRGVNNHMGSELTTLPLQMGWVMQTLLRRDLYFVDSRTNAATVAAKTAADYSVPNLSRSVFLDNEIETGAIREQFRRLVTRAEKDGLAVGIGHPYLQTAAVLQAALPALKCRGIELALVSEVLKGANDSQPTPQPTRNHSPSSLEPDFDIPFRHIGLGLGNRVFAEVENARGEYRVGTTEGDAFNQVIQVANAP
jgi:uncharacterized protein